MAGSLALHLLAAATTLAVSPWLSRLESPVAEVELLGRKGVVLIEGSFAQPVPPAAVFVAISQTEAPVVVTPREARVEQRTYTQSVSSANDFAEVVHEANDAMVTPSATVARHAESRDESSLPPSEEPPSLPIAKAAAKPPATALSAPAMNDASTTAPSPARVGNATTAASGGLETAASFAGNPPPIYPAIAVQNGWSGSVLLKLWIDESGAVTEVRVERSSGYGVLDAAAVTAVRQWRGTAKRMDGRSVASVELQEIKFRPR